MVEVYVIYHFIHSNDRENDELTAYSKYKDAKKKYECLREKYIDFLDKSYVEEGEDNWVYSDWEYSVKIGIRKLVVE